MKIFLIGMPAAGKTYCGEILKKKLKVPAYDLDNLIEIMEEQTISEIFAEGGEESFRKAEAKMLRLFKEKKSFIVSCGGGAPCFHNNMEWMNSNGVTIWIDEPHDILVKRLLEEKDKRPLINGKDEAEIKKYVDETLNKRSPYYIQATHRVSAEELTSTRFLKLIKEYA